MKYILQLEEEEVAIVLQALSQYQYENPYCITEEQYEIANNVVNKIDDLIN